MKSILFATFLILLIGLETGLRSIDTYLIGIENMVEMSIEIDVEAENEEIKDDYFRFNFSGQNHFALDSDLKKSNFSPHAIQIRTHQHFQDIPEPPPDC